MGIGVKVGLTTLVVIVGAVAYGFLRDVAGHGQYFLTAGEVILLVWLWTRPSKKRKGTGYTKFVSGESP